MNEIISINTLKEYRNEKKFLINVVEINNKHDINSYLLRSVDFFEILFIIEGEGDIYIEKKHHCFNRNDVLFISNKKTYSWKVKKDIRGLSLIFIEDSLNFFFVDPFFMKRFHFFDLSNEPINLNLSSEEMGEYLELLSKMRMEFPYSKIHSDFYLQALFYQIIININRKYIDCIKEDSAFKSNCIVKKITDYIDSNINSVLRIEEMSDQMGISHGCLSIIIKKNFNCTPKEFIQKRKIIEAKRLLIYSNLSVKEIAYMLSFEDSSYFCKYFKKNTGDTPIYYRDEFQKLLP